MSGDRRKAATRLLGILSSGEVRCAIVGLGFIGSTLMDAFRKRGIQVRGYDRDREVVRRFLERDQSRSEKRRGTWSVGDDPSVLADAHVVVVAVRALVRGDATDLEPLRSIADVLRSCTAGDRLVILESTVAPGTTRRFSEWCHGGTHETFVAHSPERLSVGHDWRTLRDVPHLVGGIDAESTELAERILSRICDHVRPVSGPEVSELSKLLENAFLTVGIALIGEITKLAHAMGIAAREVTEAAATKPTGYHAFHPGPGVGGHCLPNDLRILEKALLELGHPAELLTATRHVVDALPGMVVDRLERVLGEQDRSLNGATVLLVGMGFKIGCTDTTGSPAFEVVRRLRDRGAEVEYLDGGVATFEVDGQSVPRVAHDELAGRGYGAVVLLAGEPTLTAEAVREAGATILDAGGGRLLGDPLPEARLL